MKISRLAGQYLFLIVVVTFALSSLQGCVALVPIVKSYSEIGVTEGDRMALLEEKVDTFNDAMYWGKMQRALEMSDKTNHDSLRRELRRRKKEERVVETEIEFVDFSEEAYKANVDVLVKYFKVPFYVVNERLERQEWEFETGMGWKFVKLEQVAEEESKNS